MDKRKILIQLDSDIHASVFDRVVAVDAGAEEIFSYAGVKSVHVQGMVHGAIFTRRELKRTAIFIGGSDVSAGEKLLADALKHMIPKFGLRVSIMLDSNGANTTAAAAVRAAARHLDLKDAKALVIGTGPVGQRIARLLARQGSQVRVSSPQLAAASALCDEIRARVPDAQLQPAVTMSDAEFAAALEGRTLVISAGPAGVALVKKAVWSASRDLRVAIDLNAVPPLGMEGIGVGDKAVEKDGAICYGAIGVGDTKMKVHRAAIASLFESNDKVLDVEEIYQIAQAF